MVTRTRKYGPGLIARLFSAENWKLTLARQSPDTVRLDVDGRVDLKCLEIVAISSSKQLLWHTVEIRSRARVDRLAGLSRDTAVRLAADLKLFVNDYLADVIRSESSRLREIDASLHAAIAARRSKMTETALLVRDEQYGASCKNI